MIIEMSDSIYKALADPNRRTILQLLRKRDRTVSELLEQVPVGASTLSHHLDTLKKADLVTAEREGQFIRYSLNTSVFQDVLAFLTSLFPQ